eukprot:gene27022-biopygen17589
MNPLIAFDFVLLGRTTNLTSNASLRPKDRLQ